MCNLHYQEHDYATIECPNCHSDNNCWECAVRCTNDSTGEGVFTCRNCGHSEHYPFEE